MVIGGISAGSSVLPGQPGGKNQNDPVAKGIQDKIQRAQQQLQELSANTDLSLEQKQKKRQEIQQQISDLNMQLRQHQIEQQQKERQERQQALEEASDSMSATKNEKTMAKEGVTVGISAEGMEALISADGAKKMADIQGSTATQMEGKANVLESEIAMDMALGKGVNVGKKQEDMEKLRQKAQAAETAQIGTLGEINRKLEEVAEKDLEEKTEVEADTKTDEDLENTAKADEEAQSNAEQKDVQEQEESVENE